MRKITESVWWIGSMTAVGAGLRAQQAQRARQDVPHGPYSGGIWEETKMVCVNRWFLAAAPPPPPRVILDDTSTRVHRTALHNADRPRPQCHLLHATEETITLHLSTHASPSLEGELEHHPGLQAYAITYRPHTNASRTNDCLEEGKGVRVPLEWEGGVRRVEVVLKTKDVLPRRVHRLPAHDIPY